MSTENQAQASFERMRPRYIALPRSQLLRINLDFTPTIGTALAACPRILALRPEMEKMYDFNLEVVDCLEDAALGLEYTHSQVVACAHPPDDLQDLHREATQTRARLVLDLNSLAAHGIVDARDLARLTKLTGYKSVIEDIRACIATYRTLLPRIEGRSYFTPEDLNRAEAVVHTMSTLLAKRSIPPGREWKDLRTRAFSLLCSYYDQARRAVTYLRWNNGDLDSIAPSLYKRRNKRPSRSAPIGPNGPFMPSTPVNADSASASQPRLAGMPGGSPFIR